MITSLVLPVQRCHSADLPLSDMPACLVHMHAGEFIQIRMFVK